MQLNRSIHQYMSPEFYDLSFTFVSWLLTFLVITIIIIIIIIIIITNTYKGLIVVVQPKYCWVT